MKIFTPEGFVNHVTSSREDLFSGTHTVVFAASDPHGESVILLRAIGLRYYAVVIIRGGFAYLFSIYVEAK